MRRGARGAAPDRPRRVSRHPRPGHPPRWGVRLARTHSRSNSWVERPNQQQPKEVPMRTMFAFLLAAAALAFAGCGGGGGGGGGETTSSPAPKVAVGIEIKGGKPIGGIGGKPAGGIRRATVSKGDDVLLLVKSDVA